MVRSVCAPLAACLVLLVCGTTVQAEVRSVGPGKTFAAPCAAFAAAIDGDVIEIDGAGSYVGDVCTIARNNLTIKGVNGRPHIAAGGKNSGGKATWVVAGRDTVIDNIELSGARVPEKNGAGIRQEGRNLTVRRSYFHDNENGILGGADAESVYVIEDSEFANNGAGDGQSHNMYIGEIKSFTLRGCYSHDAVEGHLVKSRALANFILYNRLSDEAGTASYELDCRKEASATWSATCSRSRQAPAATRRSCRLQARPSATRALRCGSSPTRSTACARVAPSWR